MNTSARDHHMALFHRFFEAYLQGDPAILDEVVWPDYYQVNGGTRQTLEETKQDVPHFAGTTFSMAYTVDDAVVCGDNAFVRVTFDRTHVASGRKSTYTSLFWSVARDGKISHGWGMHDIITAWQQEGVLPTGPALNEWVREQRAKAAGANGGTSVEDADA